MKILLTGGGTGGHITPLLAVAQKLKAHDTTLQIIYVGEHNGKFAHLTHEEPNFDETHEVFAGKFRRYHGENLISRLLDIRTNLLNLRDALFVCIGLVQSYFLLRKVKPDVILLKGGFVGVPIGLTAAFLKIPFVTHDSDALPGLANRLVTKWAAKHATGMPPEFYTYPKESMEYVGVLVSDDYKPITSELQKAYRLDLKLPVEGEVLLITGGSHGAQRLNDAMVKVAPKLLETFPKLRIVHQVGAGNQHAYGEYTHNRLEVLEFLHGMYRFTGAADVVVTRAGANTLAELGVQGKACIVIPSPFLAGGHQLKNAEHFSKAGAVIVVDEATLKVREAAALTEAITALLHERKKRETLGKQLQDITIRDAADKLASLLISIGRGV